MKKNPLAAEISLIGEGGVPDIFRTKAGEYSQIERLAA